MRAVAEVARFALPLAYLVKRPFNLFRRCCARLVKFAFLQPDHLPNYAERLHLCFSNENYRALAATLCRGRRRLRMHARYLAKALNLLYIVCLLGSCRAQHNDSHILVEASLSDHSPSGLCKLHVCELRREEDYCARLT